MAQFYVYAPDEQNMAHCGLVGALVPTSVEFELQAGEFGELTMEHPLDDEGKWRAITDGCVIKAPVPVREVPEFNVLRDPVTGEITETITYIETVHTAKMIASATKEDRTLYKGDDVGTDKKKDKKVKEIDPTKVQNVVVIQAGYVESVGQEAPKRYKVKVTVKEGKPNKPKLKTYTGWINTDGLDFDGEPVDPDPTQPVPLFPTKGIEIDSSDSFGIESVSKSYSVRDQLFRVYNVEVTIGENDTGNIKVSARRLPYDLLGNVTTYRHEPPTGDVPDEVNCQTALNGVLSNCLEEHSFTAHTDIGDVMIGEDARDLNPVQAIIDPELGIATRWGAQICNDDEEIYLLRHVGKDRGVTLQYKKNLLGVTCKTDSSNVAIGIRPVGIKKDGTRLYLDTEWDATTGEFMYNNDKKGSSYVYTRDKLNDYFPAGNDGRTYYVRTAGTGASKHVVDPTVIYCNQTEAEYATPKIFVLECSEAKEDAKNYKLNLCRRRMVREAMQKFIDGCDIPEITLECNFSLMGDSDEYAQYRGLESMFVYDTVRIYHPRVGVETSIQLTSIKWDCLAGRMLEATFGSLEDEQATVSSWQISSVDGGKISPSSINAKQIGSGSITERTIGEGAIVADHLSAGSVTANAIKAGEITTDKIRANAITGSKIDADSVTAEIVKTDTLETAVASIAVAKIENANIDHAQIKILDAETGRIDQLIVKDETNLNKVLIERLVVMDAQMMHATVNELILKASDGNYYRLDVNDDGNLEPTQVTTPTDAEIEAGVTSDGKRSIIETELAVEDLTTHSLQATKALINELVVDKIDVDTLFAREAFIDSLKGARITIEGDTIEFIAGKAKQAAADVITAQETAAAAKSSIDGLQVGGRNLLRLSGTMGNYNGESRMANQHTDGTTFNGNATVYTQIAWSGMYFNIQKIAERCDLKIGDELTLSKWYMFDAQPSKNVSFTLYRFNSQPITVSIPRSDIIPGKWFRVSMTATIDEYTLDTSHAESRIENNYYEDSQTYGFSQKLYESSPMIQRGNRATDWTPAPEDVDAGIAGANTAANNAQAAANNAQAAANEAMETVESAQVEVEEEAFKGETVSAALEALQARTTSTASITFGTQYPADAKEGDYHFLETDGTVHRRAYPDNMFDVDTGYAMCSGNVTYQATGGWSAAYIDSTDITDDVLDHEPYTATAAVETMIVTGGKSVTVKDTGVAKAKNILSKGKATLEMNHTYAVAWKDMANSDPVKAARYAPKSVVIGEQEVTINPDGSFRLVVAAPTAIYFSEPVNLHVAEKAALWPVEDGAVASAVIRAANAANTADRKIMCYYSETYPDSGFYEEWVPEDDEFIANRDRFIRFAVPDDVHVVKITRTTKEDEEGHITEEVTEEYIEETDAKGLYAEIQIDLEYRLEGSWARIDSATYDSGDLWIDEQANRMCRWNGTYWSDVLVEILDAAMVDYDRFIERRSAFFDDLENLPQYMSIRDGIEIHAGDQSSMKLNGATISFEIEGKSFTRMGAGFQQMGDYQVKAYPGKGGLAFFYAPVGEEE